MTTKALKVHLLELQKSNNLFLRLKQLSYRYDIYVCGGYLRNILMGNKRNKDIDVFIDCNHYEFSYVVEEMSKWGNMQYGQYGSPRLYIPESGIEYIDIVPFYNFIVAGKPLHSIDEILRNFDFTANAIAWSIKDDELLDPLNAIDDISQGILKAVRLDFPEMMVNEEIPISAVSVFWFRLLHYQNKLRLRFDPTTENWIIENKFRMRDYNLFCKYFFEPSFSGVMLNKLQ